MICMLVTCFIGQCSGGAEGLAGKTNMSAAAAFYLNIAYTIAYTKQKKIC